MESRPQTSIHLYTLPPPSQPHLQPEVRHVELLERKRARHRLPRRRRQDLKMQQQMRKDQFHQCARHPPAGTVMHERAERVSRRVWIVHVRMGGWD